MARSNSTIPSGRLRIMPSGTAAAQGGSSHWRQFTGLKIAHGLGAPPSSRWITRRKLWPGAVGFSARQATEHASHPMHFRVSTTINHFGVRPLETACSSSCCIRTSTAPDGSASGGGGSAASAFLFGSNFSPATAVSTPEPRAPSVRKKPRLGCSLHQVTVT